MKRWGNVTHPSSMSASKNLDDISQLHEASVSISFTFQNTPEDSAVSNDLLNLNNGLVDIEKVRS